VYGGQILSQQLIVGAPAIGYKLTEHLSVGASIGIGNSTLGARLAVRAPSDLVALTGLLGDLTQGLDDVITLGLIPFPLFGGGIHPFNTVSIVTADNLQDNFTSSYNLGVLWEPNEWFAAGITYQSATEANYSGHYTVDYSQEWRNLMDWLIANQILALITEALELPTQGGVETQSGRLSVIFKMPQRVQMGIMVRPIERLRLTCDVNWTNWAAENDNVVVLDQPMQLLQVARVLGYSHPADTIVIKRDFKDTIGFGIGMELDVTSWYRFRAGYENRPTSQRPHLMDMTMPLPDMQAYSVGGAADLTRNSEVEWAFSWLIGDNVSLEQEKGTISTNMNSRALTDLVYNPYAGLNVYQETEIMMFSVGLKYQW